MLIWPDVETGKLMRTLAVIIVAALLAACAATSPEHAAGHKPADDFGLQWVKSAAEYRAITRQVYAAASRDLVRFVDDPLWSALPQQKDAAGLPPAVILDVDETVVSNVDFQLTFERPFANWKLEEWTRATPATPVEGVREFVTEARRLGVTVFFVTNRPCEPEESGDDPCPQKQTTVEDIAEVGIETDADHVLLSGERGWTKEKLSRRLHVARTHRVIMLIGDDFGDFVACSRHKPLPPCAQAASQSSRLDALDTYDHYWGNGWYVLPNPMHGSWTTVD